MSNWQPIETAPKDGTRILVGRFDRKASQKHPNNFAKVDFWHTAEKHGYSGFGQFNNAYWPPTHWMPLPQPPETQMTDTSEDQEQPYENNFSIEELRKEVRRCWDTQHELIQRERNWRREEERMKDSLLRRISGWFEEHYPEKDYPTL